MDDERQVVADADARLRVAVAVMAAVVLLALRGILQADQVERLLGSALSFGAGVAIGAGISTPSGKKEP